MNIQKLREIPIEAVAQTLGMKVQKHKTLCPFHNDKHPSLSFKVSKNTFKCFVCDAHGSTIDLAMQVLGKNFKETCLWLAEEHHISVCHPDLPSCHPERSEGSENIHQELITHNSKLITEKYAKYFIRPFLNTEAKRFLFQERKLHPAVVRWCRLTSWTDRYGTPWLQIPYFDVEGTLIGVQNRRLDKGEGARFRFPRGSSCNIYNLPVLKLLTEGEPLYISEGCSDCWSLLSSGYKAVAIPSATLLKTRDIEMLKGLNLHMYPDRDVPGEKLFLQLKAHCPGIIHHSLPEGIKDFSEWYMSSRIKLITHNSKK